MIRVKNRDLRERRRAEAIERAASQLSGSEDAPLAEADAEPAGPLPETLALYPVVASCPWRGQAPERCGCGCGGAEDPSEVTVRCAAGLGCKGLVTQGDCLECLRGHLWPRPAPVT